MQFLRDSRCSTKVIKHCEAVAALALETAQLCVRKGLNVDLALVEAGALLHDVGRSRTHTVHHAVIGAEMAKSAGLPEPVVSIIKRHVGGGITRSEAEKLGWPGNDVYVPLTLEEKIVSYADKLVGGISRVPIEVTVEQLSRELKPDAAVRVRKLHEEMAELIGERS
jgi:uncharacterized protein